MPIYEYQACSPDRCCDMCHEGFDWLQSLDSPPLQHCPKCGAPVRKQIPHISVGRSQSSLDDRAKAAGFSKLKKLGRGEYERQY